MSPVLPMGVRRARETIHLHFNTTFRKHSIALLTFSFFSGYTDLSNAHIGLPMLTCISVNLHKGGFFTGDKPLDGLISSR